jgi:hypothetical protein
MYKPTLHSHTHCQAAQAVPSPREAHSKAKFCKRATKPMHQNRHKMTTNKHDRKERQQLTGGSRCTTPL